MILLEKYAASFKTSGVDENSDGRWQWTSSKQPLFFRNWGLYGHNEERNLLLIEDEKPFVWFNGRIKNENVLLNDYFICESSAPQQEIKHVTAYVNAKVKDRDESISFKFKKNICLFVTGLSAIDRNQLDVCVPGPSRMLLRRLNEGQLVFMGSMSI